MTISKPITSKITPHLRRKYRPNSLIAFSQRIIPRICGENNSISALSGLGIGSPPHMRGKLYPTASTLPSPGITPAYAGKTLHSWFRGRIGRDHPRICGENWQHCLSTRLWIGSPPHMRGKLSPNPKHSPNPRDHPRICGENFYKRVPM